MGVGRQCGGGGGGGGGTEEGGGGNSVGIRMDGSKSEDKVGWGGRLWSVFFTGTDNYRVGQGWLDRSAPIVFF